MGAMQAQDYLAALYAVGLRMQNANEADIERALAEGSIVRSWPMRGTLHIVASADLRWMLELLTPRIVTGHAGRYAELGLDDEAFSTIRKFIRQILKGGNRLTRDTILQQFETAHIATRGPHANNILRRLGMDGLICFGPRQGKQPTFVLVDDWVPETKPMDREQALAELARRYFTGHGPASAADFSWWSGLSLAEARAGLEMVKPHLVQEMFEGQPYYRTETVPAPRGAKPIVDLLPAFDEYLIGYKDRRGVLNLSYTKRINAGGGMFAPLILSDGQVAGTWKRVLKKEAVIVTSDWFEEPSAERQSGFHSAAGRYGAFLGLTAVVP